MKLMKFLYRKWYNHKRFLFHLSAVTWKYVAAMTVSIATPSILMQYALLREASLLHPLNIGIILTSILFTSQVFYLIMYRTVNIAEDVNDRRNNG